MPKAKATYRPIQFHEQVGITVYCQHGGGWKGKLIARWGGYCWINMEGMSHPVSIFYTEVYVKLEPEEVLPLAPVMDTP